MLRAQSEQPSLEPFYGSTTWLIKGTHASRRLRLRRHSSGKVLATVAETCASGRREVKLTNLDKVFFPELGLTKGDLIRYYVDVAPHVLHHVRNRPMQMKRYPNGVEGDFFYQKRVSVPHPDWLETTHIRFPSPAARPTSRSARTLRR